MLVFGCVVYGIKVKMLVDVNLAKEQEKQLALAIRATLIQQVRALEQQRDAILAHVAILEQRYGIEKKSSRNNGS